MRTGYGCAKPRYDVVLGRSVCTVVPVKPDIALVAALLLLAAPATAQTLQQRVEATLGGAGPGVRFGLVVATAEG